MSWWFKKHPQLLEVECNRLSRNSNYKEHHRSRENLLISAGEIVVRLNATTKHPAVIIYPESTPYNLPSIILLNNVLNQDEVIALSKQHSRDAIFSLKEKVKFYNYWHQNTDGSICLLESDNLEKFGEFFTVHDVINRTREWLAGLKTGNLPPDNPEVELFAHFRELDRSKEILIPEPFLTADLRQGEFYCMLASHVYPMSEVIEKRIYSGALLQGENSKGIRIDPVEYKNAMHIMPEDINSPMDLITKSGLIKALVDKKEMVEGYWWNIECRMKPIQNITGFAKLIGKGDEVSGYTRIQNVVGNAFNSLPEEVHFAIRFLNKRDEREWQAFTLKKEGATAVPILGSNDINDFIELFENYTLAAIRCSEITERRHHLRNSNLAQRDVLKKKIVNIIGCGALGGEVADIIGKAGIGILTLVDHDIFKLDNAVRHVVGADKLGLLKVHALSQQILFHNPFVKTNPIPFDIMKVGINQYFAPGIGISTIANDNVEGYLNEQAIINNKTIFYARALRGGKVARIFRVKPGVDACFQCLSLYSNEENEVFTNIPEDSELPNITNECNNPIRPASAAELKLIASLTSMLILDYLQQSNEEHNHWIWSTEHIDGIDESKVTPYELKASTIPPHPSCQYCQPAEQLTASINFGVLDSMRVQTRRNPDIETGGVLLGEIRNGTLQINFASDPGPKAKKTHNSFEKDIMYCQQYINEKYEQHGSLAAYIGEWHYHPSTDNMPSGTDLNSLSEIANHQGYLTEDPVMIILSIQGHTSCTIHPASKTFYYSNLKIT